MDVKLVCNLSFETVIIYPDNLNSFIELIKLCKSTGQSIQHIPKGVIGEFMIETFLFSNMRVVCIDYKTVYEIHYIFLSHL